MPQGLQIWDASGNIILDTTSNVGRHTGTTTVGAASPNDSGTITVPGWASGSNIWWVAMPSVTLGGPVLAGVWGDPEFTVSGADLNWWAIADLKIVYGVY